MLNAFALTINPVTYTLMMVDNWFAGMAVMKALSTGKPK